MEQQKILWIIFSVALFILVIVGVGVIWFLPTNHGKVAQSATGQGSSQAKISFDPYEWAKSQNNAYPGLENAPAGQAGGQATTGAQGQGNGNFTIIYGQQPGGTQNGGTAAQPSVTVSPSKSAGQASKAVQPPVAAAPKPAPKTAASAPSRPARTTVTKPVASRSQARVSQEKPETRRVVQHWIQVASYTSDFRAERAKKDLESNGITGKIMSREINGRTYFRVRVGPYMSGQEAQRFLQEIKKISAFKNSYISLVYANQRVN